MPKNYVVLICSKNDISGFHTHGSGFLISKNNTCYVVTCRHVINQAIALGNLLAIPVLKKTRKPPGGHIAFALGTHWYHPLDDNSGTYDVAIMSIVNDYNQILTVKNIVPFDITDGQIVSNFNIGDRVQAEGYPEDYVKSAFAANNNELLLPLQIQGLIDSTPYINYNLDNFDIPIREAFLVQANNQNECQNGMSGSVVRIINSNKLVGVVIAKIGRRVNLQDGTFLDFQKGFLFVPGTRILEIINSLP